MKLFLASQSPRRKELFAQVGLDFEVVDSDYEEQNNFELPPQQLVEMQAVEKAKAAVLPSNVDDSIVIGADTIVVLDGNILGKPIDRNDAKAMLNRLSGKKHEVMTGVALIQGAQIKSFVITTEVFFKQLMPTDIEWYLNTGEPFDKAGAYGIQGKGAVFVRKINGSYSNVVGLPIEYVVTELNKMDKDCMTASIQK